MNPTNTSWSGENIWVNTSGYSDRIASLEHIVCLQANYIRAMYDLMTDYRDLNHRIEVAFACKRDVEDAITDYETTFECKLDIGL